MWNKQKHKKLPWAHAAHTSSNRLNANSLATKTMHEHKQTNSTQRAKVMLDPNIIVVQSLMTLKRGVKDTHTSLFGKCITPLNQFFFFLQNKSVTS